MAKRFIDTDVFKKQFIRGLEGSYKLLWLYITTDCNHAGIWECDFEVACLRLGEKIDKSKALTLFKDRIVEFDKGQKWFIPSFIEFQYGELSENNRAHTGVISVLKKYNLLDKNLKIKPLESPLQGDKDKEQDKEKEKEKEKEQSREDKTYVHPIISIVDFFNQVTGRELMATEPRKKLLNVLIKDKFTEEDFKSVIKHRHSVWKDDAKMKEFITPETLFARENFTKYLEASKESQLKASGRSNQIVANNSNPYDALR